MVEHCAQFWTLQEMQLSPSAFLENPVLQVPQNPKLEHEAQLAMSHVTQVSEMRVAVSGHVHS